MRNRLPFWVPLLMVICLAGCEEPETSQSYRLVEYHESVDTGALVIRGYRDIDVSRKGNEWKTKTYYLDIHFRELSAAVEIERWKVEDSIVYKMYRSEYEPIIALYPDSCITFPPPSDEFTTAPNPYTATYCYKGQQKITVQERDYLAYHFVRSIGYMHQVNADIFLDKEFNLLKEEFINGDYHYYLVERLP